ncbi:MarR family winged helix-turn-helix transcriptional regulator [Microbacterium sp.]|uniref:MarR family winged helix-turn-helix transcriptional regulator n=1 Tax=Microbacterium sp. TaxID=51671 RepID=UPI0039E27B98
MNTENTTDTSPRPLGYWLRAVDRLLAREFATVFEAEGITRRDWRLLNLIDGDVVAPELIARLRAKKLHGLIERGWIVDTDGRWALTDEGRAAMARLSESVAGIRSRVSGAVSDGDFATTLASLEAIARELGWNPDERLPRGPRRGFGRRGFGPGFRPGFGFRGFGPGFGPAFAPEGEERADDEHPFGPGFRPGFGPGRGFGRPGFAPGFDPRGQRFAHHERHAARGGKRHGGHGEHAAQDAYERGFDAGFARGREDRTA